MKHGIQIPYNEHFEKLLFAASEAGFEHIALDFGEKECFHGSDWEQHIIRMEKLLTKYGLTCIQFHIPYYHAAISAEKCNDPDMDQAMLRCVEAAGKLGVEWGVYHPVTAISDNCSPRKSMEYTKAAMTPLVEAAVKHNTNIAVENLPVFPQFHHLKFFGSDYEDLCELHDYFNTKEVGICWDFGHAHMMKWADEAKALRTVGKRIKCTHVHSNRQLNDDHLPPCMGSSPWERLMPELGKFYSGALMLELTYTYSPETKNFFRYSLDNLDYLESLI